MTSSTILLLIYKPLLLLIVAHLPQFRRKKYLKNVLYFLLFSYITAPSKHLLSKCFPNLTPLLEVLRHLEPETHKDPEAHTHRFTPNTTDAHTQIRRNTHKHNHIHRPSPALWTHTQTQKHNHTQTHPQQHRQTYLPRQAHPTPSQLWDTLGILKLARNRRWEPCP